MAGGNIELVRAANPGPLTGAGTNTWIYGQDEVVVIDPGPLLEDHLDTVKRVAERRGRIAALICTHHHVDHVEGAQRLSELTAAPLALYHARAKGISDLPLHHGDRVLVGRSELSVIHTPGHASDHICLYSERDRVVFTGDHVLSGTTSVIWPPDGDMDDYLTSLELIRGLGPARLLPGHGDPIEDPASHLLDLADHRLEREAQVLEALRSGPARPEDLVPRLYADYPREVWEPAAKTVLAHCLRLEKLGKVRRLETPGGSEFELSAIEASPP